MELRPQSSGEHRSVTYGSELIEYELIRNGRRSLAITVYPELNVCVRAPIGKSGDAIDSRVLRRAAWIIRQREFFRQFLPPQPERRYVSGETHYYLGRQYRLKVHRTVGAPKVKLAGRYIRVWTRDKEDTEAVRDLLTAWYRDHADILFRRHAEMIARKLRRYEIDLPPLRIQRMKKRWGSLTPSGLMILNLELIKAPVECIDYVIVHELCHTKHSGHGPNFEALLSRCLPDWRRRKERLERVVIT